MSIDGTRNDWRERAKRIHAGAYASHRGDIARLLDVLGMELDRHDDRHAADPANGGLPANLAKVRSDLIEVVAFIAGMERGSVEEFLDDGHADDEQRKDACPECERSNGPHYRGPCEH